MKTAITALSKIKGLGNIETPENNPALLHLLSPLELAAYKNQFKAFKYRIDNQVLEIEPYTSKALYWHAKAHVAAQRALLQKSKQKILKRDPQIRRFLQKPLDQHHLPTRIYHLLKGNDCHTMADVAKKGEQRLALIRGLGKTQLAYIMNLFINNGCADLFL